MKKKKQRLKQVSASGKEVRLRTLLRFCLLLLPPALYLSYSVSGLYRMNVEVTRLKSQIVWCLMHPLFCYNDKTAGGMGAGFLFWLIASFSAYSRMNYNFMHGNEFGSAKWGSVAAFNKKYAYHLPKKEKQAAERRVRKAERAGGIKENTKTKTKLIEKYGKWLIRSRKQGNAAGRGISPVLAFDAIHFVTYICTMC